MFGSVHHWAAQRLRTLFFYQCQNNSEVLLLTKKINETLKKNLLKLKPWPQINFWRHTVEFQLMSFFKMIPSWVDCLRLTSITPRLANSPFQPRIRGCWMPQRPLWHCNLEAVAEVEIQVRFYSKYISFIEKISNWR